MQNNFRVFEELVFFDLWTLDSSLRFPVSGFRFPVSDSEFRVPRFRVALSFTSCKMSARLNK